jgi:hypothetical protein
MSNVKVKDAPSDVSVGIATYSAIFPRASGWFSLAEVGCNSYLPGRLPPLNVLYGVYLI